MSGTNRTLEFFSTVEALKTRRGLMLNNPSTNSKIAHEPSEFSKISKQIGADISSTFSKLEKLSLLAKRKSLFDDRPLEIQELTYIIKQDLNALNSQIARLQQILSRNPSSEPQSIQKHSKSVVMSLQTKLADMSQDFKSVLETRNQNLREQKERREQFASSPSTSHRANMTTSSQEIRKRIPAEESKFEADSNRFVDSASHQFHQLQLASPQDAYLQSRSDAVQSIESTIVELGGIFQQLATMVQEQGEQVQRIDSFVGDTEMNIDAAHSQLLKYFESIQSNRWLMLKIFGVLLLFFFLFVAVT